MGNFCTGPSKDVEIHDSVIAYFQTEDRYKLKNGEILEKLRQEGKEKLKLDSKNFYNIALIGQAGVGKSAMINGLRTLKAGDPSEAKEGEIETTGKMTRYQHPIATRLMLWDCPGSGTQAHGQATYFYDNYLFCFDYLVIVFAVRLGEAEIDLMKQAIAHCVPVACVRNKVDQDFENRRRRDKEFRKWPKHVAVVDLIKELRNNTIECLKTAGISILPPIFMINSWALKEKDDDEEPDEVKFEEKQLVEYVLRDVYNRRNKKNDTRDDFEFV